MLSKHASELCVLLVDDIFGELPSRIIAALFIKGRSTAPQLARYTALSLKQIKHGLVLLSQYNLVCHDSNNPTRQPWYEAKALSCYNILKIGKVVDLMEERYGHCGRAIVEVLFQCGHIAAFALQDTVAEELRTKETVQVSEAPASPDSMNHTLPLTDRVQSCLRKLSHDGIVEVVSSKSFQTPDSYVNILPSGNADLDDQLGGIKIDEKKQPLLQKRLREAQVAKRSADPETGLDNSGKKRRLRMGNHVDSGDGAELTPHNMIRLNVKKCLIHESQPCDDTDHGMPARVQVDTLEIFHRLKSKVDLSSGVGKVSGDLVDLRSAERVRKTPDPDGEDSDGSGEEDHSVNRFDQEAVPNHAEHTYRLSANQHDAKPHTSAQERTAKVTFEERAACTERIKDRTVENLLMHLRLLSESRQTFLRHCGKNNQGQWTVDVLHLLFRLRQTQIDTMINQWFGRQGLRLTRILRDKGKMEEKSLRQMALMKKPDVQAKLLAMHTAGIVEVQEVPRDGSRLANRTMFLWFFDSDRCRAHLLDDIHKVMLRCLQTLKVERYKHRAILSCVDRTDVRGRETEVIADGHLNEYNRYIEAQQKLLSQVLRLDDIVAILRDYVE